MVMASIDASFSQHGLSHFAMTKTSAMVVAAAGVGISESSVSSHAGRTTLHEV